MIPASVPEQVRAQMLVIVPPLLWLISDASDCVSGQRLDALALAHGPPRDRCGQGRHAGRREVGAA